MTLSNGNIFWVTGPLWGYSTGYRCIPLTKASDAELWYFLWSAPEINGSTNNHDAGDLRRYRAHYDVTVMKWTNSVQDLPHILPQYIKQKAKNEWIFCASNVVQFSFWYRYIHFWQFHSDWAVQPWCPVWKYRTLTKIHSNVSKLRLSQQNLFKKTHIKSL